MNSAVVISVVVESSRCSSKTLQEGSCPYAPLDEALGYVHILYSKSAVKKQNVNISKDYELHVQSEKVKMFVMHTWDQK